MCWWCTFGSDNAGSRHHRGGFRQPDDRVKQPIEALLAISPSPFQVNEPWMLAVRPRTPRLRIGEYVCSFSSVLIGCSKLRIKGPQVASIPGAARGCAAQMNGSAWASNWLKPGRTPATSVAVKPNHRPIGAAIWLTP